MAKQLPYFKFEPSRWEMGSIQMCSREEKGLFIDLCCIYWARLGELPYALALQKYCNGNNTALQGLINNEVIVVNDGFIIIEFLDEQLNEFQKTSEERRKAAEKRWKIANEMQMHTKSNARREEKRREEKRREEKRNSSASYDTQFALFWKHWKNKKSKETAKKAFIKFLKRSKGDLDEVTLKVIKKANEYFTELELKKKYDVWAPEPQYPATWLNNKTYQEKFMTTKEEIFSSHPEAIPKEDTSHVAIESPFKKSKQ